jgi:MoxR-like ATPase
LKVSYSPRFSRRDCQDDIAAIWDALLIAARQSTRRGRRPGVPRIEGETSIFCPPPMIARDEPYCLFCDEINGASQDVQRSLFSLLERYQF